MNSTELKTKNFWLLSDDDIDMNDISDIDDKETGDENSPRNEDDNLGIGPSEENLDEEPLDLNNGEEDAE